LNSRRKLGSSLPIIVFTGGSRKTASSRGADVSAEALHDVSLMKALVMNANKIENRTLTSMARV
jgi:hypothetical protein